jgi:hypothetical protein
MSTFSDQLQDKTVDELKALVYERESAAKLIHEEIKVIESVLVCKVAEFEIGERVLVKEYTGKEAVYEITDRRPGFSFGNVRYWGRVVKKDGNLGKLNRDISYSRLEKIT